MGIFQAFIILYILKMSFLAYTFQDFVTNLSKLWWFIREQKNTHVTYRLLIDASEGHSNSKCKFQFRNKHKYVLSIEKVNRSKNMKRIW